MSTALIGYTGFVGSNIANQKKFNAYYNSSNINEISGKSFDLLVCAGVPAVKWWSNKNPVEDKAVISKLFNILKTVNAKKVVLISTVDVYNSSISIDESVEPNPETLQPYGKNRRWLELKMADNFDDLTIIRLPGLFGKGLKKNVLFDLICSNILEKINIRSTFQWYPISRIWGDIEIAIENRIKVVNFSVEPIETGEIKDKFFSNLTIGSDPFPTVAYDMKSIYSKLYKSSSEGYLLSREDVFLELESWLKEPEVNYV